MSRVPLRTRALSITRTVYRALSTQEVREGPPAIHEVAVVPFCCVKLRNARPIPVDPSNDVKLLSVAQRTARIADPRHLRHPHVIWYVG